MSIADTPETVCSWPVSSQYSPGSRLLYYVLILACVFARDNKRLRQACIIASLLFPAVAAVHSIVLAVLHNHDAIDMDIFGAFQLCSIGILAAPVTVPLSRIYFTNSIRMLISSWTVLILIGLLSLTIEFYRTTGTKSHTSKWTNPSFSPGQDLDPILSPNDGSLGLLCPIARSQIVFSPIRAGSANNIYVIPAKHHLNFSTATLLAAACCIPAILSLVSMWNKILEVNWKAYFGSEREDEGVEEPVRVTLQPISKLDRFNLFLRVFLSIMEIPIFSLLILVILILGERNLFSAEVSYQMEPMPKFWEWAVIFPLLAVLGASFHFRAAESKNEEKPARFITQVELSPTPVYRKRRPAASEGEDVQRVIVGNSKTYNKSFNTKSIQSSAFIAFKQVVLTLERLSMSCERWIFDGKQLKDTGCFINYGITEGSLRSLLESREEEAETPVEVQHRSQLTVLSLTKSWIRKVFHRSTSIANQILGLERPPPGAGKTRIEWQCRCGHKSFDDFIQLSQAGRDHLKSSIRGSDTSSTISTTSSFSSLARTLSTGMASFLGSVSFKLSKTNSGELPLHTRGSPDAQLGFELTQTQVPPAPNEANIYLLLCYNEGRWAVKLLQLDLMKLEANSDTNIFKLLFTQYNQMRGGYLAPLSLRTLTNIKFVHFDVHRTDLVDVRKEDDIPPPEHPDYDYEPAPPELIPPVGERYMMHLFHNPSHADENSFCLNRFPKKLKEKLVYNGNANRGWGLQFIEGWNVKKIWILSFIVFGLGSLCMGVAWAFCHRSIQDAFAIAGYIAAFATISTGTTQALLVM